MSHLLRTALHFGSFSLSSVQLASALLSRQTGCLLCLAHVCFPILSFWCVFGLKFIFFLYPLADLKFLTAILPTMVLRGFPSLPPPAFVCVCLETSECPFFVNPFLLGESRGSISSDWIIEKREIKLDF